MKYKHRIGNRKIFFKRDEDSYLAESLRSLRTSIHFMEKRKNKVIIFTSTIPKEGKSTLSANYAVSAARSGEKVLLVDCDIRRPRAHESFGIDIKEGITEVILGEKKIEEVILKGVEENLDILPSKHFNQNATELFWGNKMKNLLLELRKKYDLIVLDAPPLIVSADAVILSEHADGVIYVCGYNMVSKNELAQSKKKLDRAGVNIYGVVINKVDKNGYSYDNYGYNNYRYYEEYITGDKKI